MLRMRIAIAQLNPVVGDIQGNLEQILAAIDTARTKNADLLVTSELALIGYPPRDLLLREGVVPACERAIEHIAEAAGDMTVLVGTPRCASNKCRAIHNSVAVCRNGEVIATYDKRLLPGYDVFDEDRYFEPGDEPLAIDVAGRRIGLMICEDWWRAEDVDVQRTYDVNPVQETIALGCDVLISLNASPFIIGKWRTHIEMQRRLATETDLPSVSVNQVGANDDLIFDGRSIVMNADGSVRAALPGWREAVEVIDLADTKSGGNGAVQSIELAYPSWQHELYHALVLGMGDYVNKTGNERVLLGLSGGIDSALTATIAAAAIGPQGIAALIMPSRYSSDHSRADAEALIDNLGITDVHTVPIDGAHTAVAEAFESGLGKPPADVTDENIQARLRGVLLMAASNALGGLVLITSNKSELAMGYTTLYGDMCGAYAVLGDVVKVKVYELAQWINANAEELGFDAPPIPEGSITKPPSAELRPDQTDQDTLPPYEQLDAIITAYIDREFSAERIIEETGFDAELVRQVTRQIDREEYKRHQAAVIAKVTPRAFGRGRPMPIVMKWAAVGPALMTKADAAGQMLSVPSKGAARSRSDP